MAAARPLPPASPFVKSPSPRELECEDPPVFSGDFEVRVTGSEWEADGFASFAREHGVKFTHIVLARGTSPSQPMLSFGAHGTLDEVRALARRWREDLAAEGLRVLRTKVEAAPSASGVPTSDEQARPDLYFEHHVKLLLTRSDAAVLHELGHAVQPHNAHLSANALRGAGGDHEERFVTQRCHGVGRETARIRLEALLAAVRGVLGAGERVLEVEEEYVVHDDALDLDRGWLEGSADRHAWHEERLRTAPAGAPEFPVTYQPMRVHPGVGFQQRAVFDPAVKQYGHSFRAGEPVFDDPAQGARWFAARREAVAHVLGVVERSPWAGNLVLRGSALLRAWFGDAAREAGDLDFVVVPGTVGVRDHLAEEMLAGLVVALLTEPGPGVRGEGVTSVDIWTCERASGRRLVFPFDVPGLPGGSVQLDFSFAEELPLPPGREVVTPLGTSLLVASPELVLAWKVQWLMTDIYPQGRDLHDAVLLAERTTLPLEVVRGLLEPELGEQGLVFTAGDLRSLEGEVDWSNFADEDPVASAGGDASVLLDRLVAALERQVHA